MKPERRTLTAAITPQLTPEAYALIKEGTPKPQAPAIVVTAKATSEKPPEPLAATVVQEPAVEPAKPRVQKERAPEMISFVPMTVRVPTKIPEALLKAASERKLRKSKPYTQQDIVAEAMTEWFKKNGYPV